MDVFFYKNASMYVVIFVLIIFKEESKLLYVDSILFKKIYYFPSQNFVIFYFYSLTLPTQNASEWFCFH